MSTDVASAPVRTFVWIDSDGDTIVDLFDESADALTGWWTDPSNPAVYYYRRTDESSGAVTTGVVNSSAAYAAGGSSLANPITLSF